MSEVRHSERSRRDASDIDGLSREAAVNESLRGSDVREVEVSV